MGGRGGSSASAGGAWRRQTVMEQAVAMATAEYDAKHAGKAPSLDDSIPEWVLDKKLGQGERYAWSVGDGARIKRETDKAVLVENNTDYGRVSFWMPKSWMSSPEKVRSDAIRNAANLKVGTNYNAYLKGEAASAGVKLGNARSTDSIVKKLNAKGIKHLTKDEYRNAKGHKVTNIDYR